jgi:GNAT superfamily N-acetyltransferase
MTDAGISTRPAETADAAALARLSTQLGYPMSREEARARLDEMGADADNAILVATRGGAPVAWIQVEVSRVFESPRQAEIAGLIVDASCRGSGIGARLVADAEAWARARGCRAIRVRSNVVRTRAHAFYRRAGYGEVKTQAVFEKPLESV